MLKLTNISGGQLVCDLAVEGKTLRLDNKKFTTIEDSEMTPHLDHLVELGLVTSEEVSKEKETKSTKKNTAKKQ